VGGRKSVGHPQTLIFPAAYDIKEERNMNFLRSVGRAAIAAAPKQTFGRSGPTSRAGKASGIESVVNSSRISLSCGPESIRSSLAAQGSSTQSQATQSAALSAYVSPCY
jgi:hypothetical protein